MTNSRKIFKYCVLLLALGAGAAFAAQIIGAAGDGGDDNPTTFHFNSENIDFQMTMPDGRLMTVEDVSSADGTGMQILNNGADHITTLGLNVLGVNLSGSNWTDIAFPPPGMVAIDPASGRFKFASPTHWDCYWQGAESISAEAAVDSDSPQIAINREGTAFCIFRQFDDYNYRLYANQYMPGIGWQGTVLLSKDRKTIAFEPQIAINDAGEAFCVFRQNDGSYERIYANQYVPGSGWQEAELVDAGTGDCEGIPRIALTRTGEAFCVFCQDDGSYDRVYVNQYVPGPGWQGAELVDAGTRDATAPQIKINHAGEAFCVFCQDNGSYDRVYANQYVPGPGWQGAELINAGIGDANSPQIAIGRCRAFCVFCQDNGSYERIYANKYVLSSGWQGAELVDAGTGFTAESPRIVMAQAGEEAFCVFRQSREGVQYRIYANKYVHGVGWQEAELVDAELGMDAYDPRIAMNCTGEAFCAFRQVYEYDGILAPHVHVNRYVPGYGWKRTELIDNRTRNGAYISVQIAMNEDGRAFCVFRQSDGVKYRIYANEYIADLPGGGISVNYYNDAAEPTPTPTPTPVAENKVEITHRKIEPLSGEKTLINFTLKQAGLVSIKVYNLQGRLVKTLTNEYHAAGSHTCAWGAENAGNDLAASGVYIVHIKTPSITKTQKIVVIK